MKQACVLAVVFVLPAVGATAERPPLHLIPRPTQVVRLDCSVSAGKLRTVDAGFDPAARSEIDERWTALGIGALRTSAGAAIETRLDASLGTQAYRLTVRDGRALIEGGDADGAFYGAMTLAQLPTRGSGGWSVPCVVIADRPALRWRILSDDVSRGPLPTMRYFRERIRTIAAFKMNGYSPYMEHVFLSPTDPLPAPLDGITPAQLHELDAYAAHFHVALIPEQQTFAHMHGTLRLETYANAAELPHGFLLSPNDAPANRYLDRIITQELAAVPRPPFFHIGSDETATLGLGQTRSYVEQRGLTQAFADHVTAMNHSVAPSGARIMLWDDAIEKDSGIMRLLPRDAVIVNYHYDAGAPYATFIERIASGGFDQMVAPGANNWNEVFPLIDAAIANEHGFIEAAKHARVLGAFETVWHDDGETLYEATWYPVLFASAAAWQSGDADSIRFDEDFPSVFFGSDDTRYVNAVATLGAVGRALDAAPYDRTNALFWADTFDAAVGARMASVNLRRVRLDAERVESDLYYVRPPLHANAAKVMFLAARRYDALARKFQIASEVRDMYADALAHENDSTDTTLRDLFWCRYWMWELRDSYEDIAPLYADAWKYESRDGHLASNLERYHMAAQRSIHYADAFYRATYEGYVRTKKLPPFDTVIAP